MGKCDLCVHRVTRHDEIRNGVLLAALLDGRVRKKVAFAKLDHRLVSAPGRLKKCALPFHFRTHRIETKRELFAEFAPDPRGIQEDDVIIARGPTAALLAYLLFHAAKLLAGSAEIVLRTGHDLDGLLENLLGARLLASTQLQD